MTIRIANGAGFLGDDIDAPRRLVAAAEVDYLTLEYLAELTMSILARVREKNPQEGFAKDFLTVAQSLLPALKQQDQLRVVTNAGGVNPQQCARHVARLLVDDGLPNTRIATVRGDDLLDRLGELQQQGCPLTNLDTGRSLAELSAPVVAANAYLGAQPIVEGLAQDARIVITGRVADASLTVGPALHEFGWSPTSWDQLAAATVAGHLIECGAQVTGGYSQRWKEFDLSDVGYPIVELDPSGEGVITKPPASGGVVDRQSVVEQLVYEIGDPRRYLTPDVIADFTTVKVEVQAANRVRVHGVKGYAAPEDYKVSLAYHDGYMASGQLVVYGADCVRKSRYCAEMIRQRMVRSGLPSEVMEVELLGLGACVPGIRSAGDEPPPREIVLRVSVRDARREVVERFTKELAPLVTSGPAGLAGYATSRAVVRPVFAYWPTLVPKSLVESAVQVMPAQRWLE